MNTMRNRLHAAADQVEAARSNLRDATTTYHTARGEFNNLINQLCPLSEPDGVVTMGQVRGVLNNRKIALIKLVREATAKHQKSLQPQSLLPPGCMGLKDAKDLVEAWIEEQS